MQKKTYSLEFKAKLVLEAIKELKLASQIASENNINPNLLARWKSKGTIYSSSLQKKQVKLIK